jgi:hypothetical protein
MKIGFSARTLMITEKYWNKLYGKENCWCGATQAQLHDVLKEEISRKSS